MNTRPRLGEIFSKIFPIGDFSEIVSLSFRSHRFEEPRHSVEECKDHGVTYAVLLFVVAELVNNETDEVKS